MYAEAHMRGANYPSQRRARCPDYDPCVFCKGCTKFNPHSTICTTCEGIKPLHSICKHTDQDQYVVKRITEITKMPMFHPDKKPTDVGIPVAENPEWEQLADHMTKEIVNR